MGFWIISDLNKRFCYILISVRIAWRKTIFFLTPSTHQPGLPPASLPPDLSSNAKNPGPNPDMQTMYQKSDCVHNLEKSFFLQMLKTSSPYNPASVIGGWGRGEGGEVWGGGRNERAHKQNHKRTPERTHKRAHKRCHKRTLTKKKSQQNTQKSSRVTSQKNSRTNSQTNSQKISQRNSKRTNKRTVIA